LPGGCQKTLVARKKTGSSGLKRKTRSLAERRSGPGNEGAGDWGRSARSRGDFDGDGRSDAVADIPGNAWRFQVYRAIPGGWASAVTHDAHNFVALELGDLDGDGRADVVLQPTGSPPRVEVYLSPLR